MFEAADPEVFSWYIKNYACVRAFGAPRVFGAGSSYTKVEWRLGTIAAANKTAAAFTDLLQYAFSKEYRWPREEAWTQSFASLFRIGRVSQQDPEMFQAFGLHAKTEGGETARQPRLTLRLLPNQQRFPGSSSVLVLSQHCVLASGRTVILSAARMISSTYCVATWRTPHRRRKGTDCERLKTH